MVSRNFVYILKKWFRSKTRIGGTKKLNIDAIKALSPDLIIANKEENTQNQIEELAGEFPVWISDIKTVNDALEMMEEVGKLVGKAAAASEISSRIRKSFGELRRSEIPRTVAYLIWYKPWMVGGGDTFIGDMIRKMGWINVFEDRARYPEITLDELKKRAPEVVLLSSEPFPFKQKHVEEIQTFLPFSEIKLVDGEMFSWYGSRIEQAIPYLKLLING